MRCCPAVGLHLDKKPTETNLKLTDQKAINMRRIFEIIILGVLPLLIWTCKENSPTQSGSNGEDPSSLIAFTSIVNGNPQIFTMFPDGTNIVQISNDSGRKGHPDWSPDGWQIVYAANYNNGTPQSYSELYIINADGTGKFLIPNTRDGHHPRWSPSGIKIAFEQHLNGNGDIYVINTDGSNKIRLTTDPAQDGTPDWSPDGSEISFQSERDGSQRFEGSLYIMNQDGSKQRSIFFSPQLFCTAWSQEGSRLIFGALQPVPGTSLEYVDLFTINPDGTDLTRITTSADGETYPSISPDGLRIVYMVNFRLFVMNIDGTGAHGLDARGRTDEDPAWSPEFNN